MPRDPRLVTRADHELIQSKVKLQGNEDYSVTIQKGKGRWVKTVHVFERRPMQSEINEYEQTASRLKWRGNKAEMEGSQINAAVNLYNKIIARAYDVQVGAIGHADAVTRDEARQLVDPLVKREAIRELIGEVYSATRMEENLGGSPDEDEDDKEDHASSGSIESQD